MRFSLKRQNLFMLIGLTILVLSVIFMEGCGEEKNQKNISENMDILDDSSNANLNISKL